MAEIPDSLRLLLETTIESRDGEYVITLPKDTVEEGGLAENETYRVALLAAATDNSQSGSQTEDSSQSGTATSAGDRSSGDPPVEVGDVRTVTIDTLGDQGDGIARVERGFILIIPGTRPGDRTEVEVTDVKESVAFAEPVSEPEVR